MLTHQETEQQVSLLRKTSHYQPPNLPAFRVRLRTWILGASVLIRVLHMAMLNPAWLDGYGAPPNLWSNPETRNLRSISADSVSFSPTKGPAKGPDRRSLHEGPRKLQKKLGAYFGRGLTGERPFG